MTSRDQIKQAIAQFVKGGDESDTRLLDRVLHDQFRVTNNGYMGTAGVTIIDKTSYLKNIESGLFGGVPRTMTIERIDEEDTVAMVKLRLVSTENDFVSYNSLVLDVDGQWKIINNLAVVTAR